MRFIATWVFTPVPTIPRFLLIHRFKGLYRRLKAEIVRGSLLLKAKRHDSYYGVPHLHAPLHERLNLESPIDS